MTSRVVFLALTIVAIAFAQCGSNPACGQSCYDPSAYTCATDSYNSKPVLCSKNLAACNGACYDPSAYWCNNGQLAQGQAPQAVKATTSAAKTTTSSAAKATTSSAAVKATTSAAKTTSSSSTTQATTTSSTPASAKPTTSSSSTTQATTAAPTAAAATSCQSMFQNLKCRTFSEDPTQVNANDVSNSRNWVCSTFPQYCTQISSGGQWTTCNSVEQLSFAMDAYYAAKGPDASACSFGGIGRIIGAAVATTAAAPVVAPTPSPYPQFPAQTADLRIINNCKSQLWFEARYGNQGAPLPGQSTTAVQALPGSYVDYVIPDTGLSGSRFWAKYGCDNQGKNCAIGDQMQYWPNPPGGCPPGGCTPPVDSLFEATWGCRPGSSCNTQNPTTWFDTSQVDGWTIPYKLTPVGDTSGCDCNGPNCGFKGVDASTLDVAKCPSGEDLSANGNFTSVNVQGNTVGLKSVDLRIINQGQILGCMSPCKRLNWGVPYGLQQDESSGSTMWMCCPTPSPQDCSPSNGCVSPQACRAGPIENTQYVAAVHNMAPGVYSYSYDDGVGLHACPAGVTKYTMEFCPVGSAAYPGTA